jgi:hypothetical protein
MSRDLTSFAAFFLPELRAAGCFVPAALFYCPMSRRGSTFRPRKHLVKNPKASAATRGIDGTF